MELAHWTSALATPASAHAAALKKVAAAVLKRSDASGRNRSRAEAIASGQPYPLK
jgi:hypothetical protein